VDAVPAPAGGACLEVHKEARPVHENEEPALSPQKAAATPEDVRAPRSLEVGIGTSGVALDTFRTSRLDEQGRDLSEMTDAEIAAFDTRFEGCAEALDVARAVDRRDHVGGAAKKRVRAAVKAWRRRLS
jgi:hypothetical protein